jgi:hypothetical protein
MPLKASKELIICIERIVLQQAETRPLSRFQEGKQNRSLIEKKTGDLHDVYRGDLKHIAQNHARRSFVTL